MALTATGEGSTLTGVASITSNSSSISTTEGRVLTSSSKSHERHNTVVS